MTTKETSSLDETFYKHLFSPDEATRAKAEAELDERLGQLATDGISRYEITRQMICGIVGAQERRDAEIEADQNFATTNGQPRTESARSASNATSQRISTGITNIFWLTIIVVTVAYVLPKVW